MADSDDASTSSSEEFYVFDFENIQVTENELICLLNSTNQEDKKILNSFIEKAIKQNLKVFFEILFDNGYRIKIVNNKGQTAAHLAFYEEYHWIKQRHSQSGEQIRFSFQHEFSFQHDTNEVTHLLTNTWLCEWSNSYDYTDCHGLNYLHIACFMGKIELVKKCLNSNSINACFCNSKSLYDNFTPLHFAVINDTSDTEEIVTLLLKHGANVKAKDSMGRTPLHLACRLFLHPFLYKYYVKKFISLNIMKILLEHQSDINVRDKDGNTPLLSIFPANYFELSRFKQLWHVDSVPIDETIAKFEYLVETGADLSTKNEAGNTILHLVIKNLKIWHHSSWSGKQTEVDDSNHVRIVEKIFEVNQGFEVNSENNFGERPLQLALKHFSYEIVKSLINYNADINCLKINCKNKEFFAYPNAVPNFDQLHNLINIIGLFDSKNYIMTSEANLVILKFLVHEESYCECNNNFLYELLHFGSSSHVALMLEKLCDDLRHMDNADDYLDSIMFAGLYIDKKVKMLLENIMKEQTREPLKLMYVELENELNIMKSTMLQNNISLYDVMTVHPYDIPKYIVNDFDFNLVNGLFYYDDIITGHIVKSIVRHYVLQYGMTSLKQVCSFLPDVCSRLILYYLSNADILKLYSVTTSQNVNETRFFT